MPGAAADGGSRGGRPRGRHVRPNPSRRGPGPGPRDRIGLRPLQAGDFELVHPRCVEERADDTREALAIWEAGEPEEARDVLRFALEGCGDNLWAHVALGRIALEAFSDLPLARGHFGYAVERARRALPSGFTGRLRANRAANRPFLDALEGLARCYEALGRPETAAELRREAERFSPSTNPGPNA